MLVYTGAYTDPPMGHATWNQLDRILTQQEATSVLLCT